MKRQPTRWEKIFSNGMIDRRLCRQLIQFNNQNQVKWSRSVMFDSLRPPGLYSPWNSPGQNTRVGNLSLLQGIFLTQGLNPGSCLAGRFFTNWARREAQTQNRKVTSDSLWPHGLYGPWNSPGQNTELGNLLLLQGIFPTQGSNPGHSRCRQILYQLSHKGNPKPNNLIKKGAKDLKRHFF